MRIYPGAGEREVSGWTQPITPRLSLGSKLLISALAVTFYYYESEVRGVALLHLGLYVVPIEGKTTTTTDYRSCSRLFGTGHCHALMGHCHVL